MLFTSTGPEEALRQQSAVAHSASEEKFFRTAQRGWRIVIDDIYLPCFSSFMASDNAYRKFISVEGTPIKEEKLTSVKRFCGTNRAEDSNTQSFVIKVYRYPGLFSATTILQTPQAEREYRALQHCGKLGIPVARPVGFGVQRGFGGTVLSCFLVTACMDDTVDFRKWLQQKEKSRDIQRARSAHILRQVGAHLRKIHAERFFLLTPSPKNILLQNPNTPAPTPVFIDIPGARRLRPLSLARYGQYLDLRRLFGLLVRHLGEDILEPFLETYLPDPLGRPDAALRRLILRAARAQSNKTPLSRLTGKIHSLFFRRIRGPSWRREIPESRR
jgi:hypothetical protein